MNKLTQTAKVPRRFQAGFTMVELLVALGLSAGLMFGVLQIFDANRQSSQLQSAFSEVQEGGRIAIELIARDVRMSGSWGCYRGGANVGNDPNIVGRVARNYWGRTGVNIETGGTVSGIAVKAGTDQFSISGSSSIANQIREPHMVNTVSNIQIGVGSNIPAGTNLIISNCDASDVFINTAADTAGTGIISHGSPFGDTYIGHARLGLPYTHQYFIGVYDAVNNKTSLYRKLNNGNAEELVRNVTDMQVIYGISGGKDSAVKFTPTPNALELAQTVSLRITLTLESQNLVNGVPFQKTFLATANVRNRSLWTKNP